MKMKEFGPGGASLAPPLDPPMDNVNLVTHFESLICPMYIYSFDDIQKQFKHGGK